MRLTFGCIVALALVSYTTANCQNSKDDSGWPVPIYDEGCRSLMSAMHQEWSKADVELGIVICKKLIWALLLNPNAFYKEFSADSIYYERFLECVDVSFPVK